MRLMLTHACTARAPATLLLALGVLAACDDPDDLARLHFRVRRRRLRMKTRFETA